MRRRSTLATIVSSASSLMLASAAQAGIVAPGETIAIHSSDFALPAGSLLDSTTSPFEVDYGGDVLKGTLYSAVYSVSGKLAFLYDIELDPTNNGSAAERSEIQVASFSGFTTDVQGMLDYEEVLAAARSADGGTVSLLSDTPGLGGAPALMIYTDATEYDAKGSAVFYAGDELLALNPGRVTGSASIAGVYQPTNGTAPTPPPTAIPLPPAAYSGLGVLMVMGLMYAMRRRLVIEA